MRPQKYPVVLSEEEKEQLESVIQRGKHNRREIQRAQMLLWSAEGKPDLEIANLLGVVPLTVATTVSDGRKRSGSPPAQNRDGARNWMASRQRF
jgi:DNA-binding CsgD family transcriptional regulator